MTNHQESNLPTKESNCPVSASGNHKPIRDCQTNEMFCCKCGITLGNDGK